MPTSKPPCVYYGENYGMRSIRRFQNMGVNERWDVARDKGLASDREGRACTKAWPCNINGCKRNRHHLLHGFEQRGTKDGAPLEGAPAYTHIHTHWLPAETFTFRTVPVWLKASEVNAMLDVKRLQEFLVSRRDTTQLHLMSRTMRWKHCSQCYWKRQLRGLLGSLVNTLK